MLQTPAKYVLYVGLYTLFWVTLTLIGYHIFFADSVAALSVGHYFFMIGLLWLVCAALRSVRRAEQVRRDPVILSFALSGLLLILLANFS